MQVNILDTDLDLDALLDNAPDINAVEEKAKSNREQCGELTKRIKSTNYAVGQICRLSREYSNIGAIKLFMKQGLKVEKMREQIEETEECEEKKPFWMEYFNI